MNDRHATDRQAIDRHDLILDHPLHALGQPGRPTSLHVVGRDEAAWWIERGHVDVFLVANDEETGTGARTYLFSAGSGELLTFANLTVRGTEVLAVVPGPDTQYRTIARGALLQALGTSVSADVLPALFDQLVANIAHGFHASETTTGERAIAGAHATAADQTKTLLAAHPGLWVTLQSGQASYFGSVPLERGRALPLPDPAWISLASDSQVLVQTTAELLTGTVSQAAPAQVLQDAEQQSEPEQQPTAEQPAAPEVPSHARVLDAIDALFHMLFDTAVEQKQKNEADELNRLQLRRDISSKAMSDALGSFVSLFNASGAAGVDTNGTNYLLNGCKIIGAHIGVQFKAAPRPPGEGSRDPVKDIAQASSVRTRVVALKGEWWRFDNGPLLVFPEAGGAAYALLPLRSGGYQCIDARSGAPSLVTTEFIDTLRPFAYTFYAGLPSGKLGLRDLLRFVSRGIGRDIATVAAIAFASTLLSMAIPLASGHLFDTVFPAADRGQMGQIVLILFIASVVTLMFEATRSLAMLRIESKAGSDLQAAVWDRVMNLPVPFFRDYTAGDLATRINGINEIRQALSGPVIAGLISNLFAALNIFLLFYYSARLALVAIALVVVAITVNAVLGFLSVRVQRATADVNGKVAGLVLEYLSGITKLRITGSESRAFANWAARFADQKRLALRAGGLANVSTMFNAAFPVLASALLFACIALTLDEPDARQFSTGDFIAFSVTWTIFLNAALSLVKTGIDLLSIGPTYERTKPILETLPEVDETRAYPGTLAGAVEVNNVRFSYGGDGPLVLDDVSLSVKPGEFVALVGASGSGKSTLLRLLLGFERATHGGIYYDEHHLDEVDIGALRRQLGVVLQGGRLMSGSIFSNIIGSATLTLDDAWEAARACGLDEDINAMPMGMHTLLSDGAGTLSGGQRQRLLIARAIVNKPRVVFFDEATSALDNRSQAIVSASLERLKATRVVIAHRLSTIINADRIYVLDKGKVVQCGTYDQLIHQDGLFADLAKRQMA